MQRTFVLVALTLAVASTVAAQGWNSEFGIQSGYTRIKPAGTGAPDQLDLFGVPGFTLPGVIPANASLFAIIPWKNKLAVEASVSVLQGNAIFIIGDATFFNLGLRGNYAITPKFYAAAGGAVHWVENSGQSETQLGVQGAVGYRFGFVAGLRGRVEASATFLGKSDLLPPANVYALLFGVSKQTGSRSRAAAQPRRSNRVWEPAFGVQGGYTRSHLVGGGDLTALSFPGFGGAANTFGVPAGPPTLFALFPIGRKFALEPGIDLTRVQTQGNTVFAGNLSVRVDYAVSGGWYGAVGGNVIYVKATGTDGETVTGANVGWGYRFALTGSLGGRVELDYRMIGSNTNVPLTPVNTLGLQFGVTLPLR